GSAYMSQRMPLLMTKLRVPPASQRLVARARLLELVDRAMERKLTLVSAPAGFGKTSLLREWVHQRQAKSPIAWVSLDEGDNDQARFWAYVIAALEAAQAGVGDAALPLLLSPQPPPIESVLTVLINALAPLPHDFALV